VSQASAGNAVPFYLQETIGGTDIDNQPSLRAFKDYRFRGPDLMTLQAEYDRKLCAECTPCKQGVIRTVCRHLGLVLAYDAGKVALRNSDLDFFWHAPELRRRSYPLLGQGRDLPDGRRPRRRGRNPSLFRDCQFPVRPLAELYALVSVCGPA